MNLTKLSIIFINVILAENYLFLIITEFWKDYLNKVKCPNCGSRDVRLTNIDRFIKKDF